MPSEVFTIPTLRLRWDASRGTPTLQQFWATERDPTCGCWQDIPTTFDSNPYE